MALRPLLFALALAFLFCAMAELLLYEPPASWLIPATNVLLAVIFGGLGLTGRSRAFLSRRARPLLALGALLVLASRIGSIAATPNSVDHLTVVLTLVVFAIFCNSWRWLAAVAGLVTAVWIPLVLLATPSEQIAHHLAPPLMGTMAALSLYLGRQRIVKRLLANTAEATDAKNALEVSQSQYRLLFDEMTSGLMLNEVLPTKNAEPMVLRIIEVNQAFERITGLPRGEVIGQLARELMPHIYYTAIGSARNLTGQELTPRLPCLDPKRQRHLEVRAYAPTPGLLAVILDDVSDRVLMEEQRHSLQEQMGQARRVEALGRLAGGMAHDFNNLLTPILGIATMTLEKEDLSAPVRGDLEDILEAGRRARDLTSRLLAISRRQVLRVTTRDLNQVLRHLEPILRRLLREEIDLRIRMAAEPLWVEIDPAQMDQALMTLAMHSQDAMPHGGRLLIETDRVLRHQLGKRPELTHANYSRLRIIDDSVGLSDETRANIFEPFFSSEGERAGTELGLATVYGIVTQQQGHIWVDSTPDKGTTFTMLLPAVSPPASRLKRLDRNQPDGKGRVILVVEDDGPVRKIVARVLRREGFHVLEADSPHAALKSAAAQAGKIDIILTDIIMPGMNGLQLVERLRQDRPDLRVVFMSGYTEDVLTKKGFAGPNLCFLPKPFDNDELVGAIRSAESSSLAGSQLAGPSSRV